VICPPWAQARIDTAAIGQLDAWLDGLFQATTLEVLLGGQPPKSHPAGDSAVGKSYRSSMLANASRAIRKNTCHRMAEPLRVPPYTGSPIAHQTPLLHDAGSLKSRLGHPWPTA
jgi:hypothetical protein